MERLYLRVKNSGGWMVAVGLLLRLGSVAYQYRYHLNPALDHWRFGWEMGRVARAIFEGHGFASPMYQPSGPTAWLTPVYPLLIVAGFKLFGLYTAGAAWFVLALNALFGALTALPVRATVRRVFGVAAHDAAALAGWSWALLPYSIYVAGERIWENTLTTLLAACLIWLTYWLAGSPVEASPIQAKQDGLWLRWALWGALWGVAALTSPALLSALPAMGLWVAWRHQRNGGKWFWQATTAALIFFALLTPWIARNYAEFHRVIPLRDNFWLEMHVGNNGDERKPCPDAVHPSNSAAEREQWSRLGEIGYMDAKKVESEKWLSEHPQQFGRLIARRVLFVWTGFWSTSSAYLEGEPMEYYATGYFTFMTLLAGAGFVLAWRSGVRAMLLPMAFFLLLFPAPYYLTHPSYDYRHAMDPVLVVMGAYACAELARRRQPNA